MSRLLSRLSRCSGAAAGFIAAATFAGPAYDIVDLGVVDPGDFGSQAFGVSPTGVAVGRSLGVSNQAFRWSADDGLTPLPNLGGFPYGVANAANSAGAIVGTAAVTFFGTDPRPVIWEDGVVSVLPLPVGQTLGRANDINEAGVAVGSVNGGSLEIAAVYFDASAMTITTAAPDGSTMRTAYGVNAADVICGNGTDPNNAARNVGLVYDLDADVMSEVGALPGRNGALAFDISDAGHVVGSSMLNQGSGLPFIWTEAAGMQAIPLPTGTSQGSARAVNSAGHAVGVASGAFAVPFYFDGATTVRIQDLLPPDTDWDVSMNTSSSALGISDAGVIVGTGVRGGLTRAYAMFPVASDCPGDLDDDGAVGASDLATLLSSWGRCAGCPADLDGDGQVGPPDLAALLSTWGDC